MLKRIAFLLAFVCCSASVASAEPMPGKKLLENDYVKVSHVKLEPGQEQHPHRGCYRVVYSLNDYTIEWSEHRSKLGTRHWKKGQLHYHQPGEHHAKNVGSKVAEWVLFCMKKDPVEGDISDQRSDFSQVAGNKASHLFDNPYFQVYQVKLKPGESLVEHFGGSRVIYSLSDYSLGYSENGGAAKTMAFKKGDCHWHEPGRHSLRNAGNLDAEFLIVNLKAHQE